MANAQQLFNGALRLEKALRVIKIFAVVKKCYGIQSARELADTLIEELAEDSGQRDVELEEALHQFIDWVNTEDNGDAGQ